MNYSLHRNKIYTYDLAQSNIAVQSYVFTLLSSIFGLQNQYPQQQCVLSQIYTEMPEFCELRYIALLLSKQVVNKLITDLQFNNESNIILPLPSHVKNITTKGKQLFIELSNDADVESPVLYYIVIHLMLHGKLTILNSSTITNPCIMSLKMEDQTCMVLQDTQGMAAAILMDQKNAMKLKQDIAPMLWIDDQLEQQPILSQQHFCQQLQARRYLNRSMKQVLSEQKLSQDGCVSGLGQWFIKIMLQHVGIDAVAKCRAITETQLKSMYKHVHDTSNALFNELQQCTNITTVYSLVKQLRKKYEHKEDNNNNDKLRTRLHWLLQHTNTEWLPAVRPAYHTWVSLILSQRISFVQSRAIRSRLYSLWNDSTITPERILALTPMQWSEVKITDDQGTKILAFTHWCSELTAEELNNADLVCAANVGLGEWSKKSFVIDTGTADNVFISEDLYVRLNLQIIGECKMVPTEQQAMEWIIQYIPAQQHTLLSRILRRLKKTSAVKLTIDNQFVLTCNDFW